MSNTSSIQAALPIGGSGDNTAPLRRTVSPQISAAKPVPLFVNPSFQYDPTVGLVVIDFHDTAGTVTNSIPSQRQLEAYRNHTVAPPGEPAPMAPKAPPPVNDKTAVG